MASSHNLRCDRFARSLAGGLSVVLFLVGCRPSVPNDEADGRLPVFVGIPPLAFLVEQIGDDRVKVDVLVQPGQDPHAFEPSPQQILALGRAEIFFKIDMPFETVLLEKVRSGNPRLKVVDATSGIHKRAMDVACCEHAPDNEHRHSAEAGGHDPHVWLAPPLLKIMAQNVAAALCRSDPLHQTEYEAELARLLKRLEALNQRIQQKLAPYRGRSFYVYHPGFGYFADAYGLKEKAVEAGGREPAPRELQALIEKARNEGIKTVFVQQQLAPSSAQVVANALAGKVVQIDGLGRNVITNIEDIANKLERSFMERRGSVIE